VDDLASAVEFLLLNYDEAETINIGSGSEVTIQELAETISEVVGFTGSLRNDSDKPDGTPRKMLDSSRLSDIGWQPSWDLRAGIADAYRWFVETKVHYARFRVVYPQGTQSITRLRLQIASLPLKR